MRAFNSGISLTKEDASIVKGMLNRGDRQHDIASWFGVNGGRIAEISTGKKFKDVVTKNNNLPPRGPYLSGMDMMNVKTKIEDVNKIVRKIDLRLNQENDISHIWFKNDVTIINNKINELLEIL